MKSFLPNDIKDENRKIIFEILLQNPELVKVEITEKTTMSFVTVSKIVSFFEKIKILTMRGKVEMEAVVWGVKGRSTISMKIAMSP